MTPLPTLFNCTLNVPSVFCQQGDFYSTDKDQELEIKERVCKEDFLWRTDLGIQEEGPHGCPGKIMT